MVILVIQWKSNPFNRLDGKKGSLDYSLRVLFLCWCEVVKGGGLLKLLLTEIPVPKMCKKKIIWNVVKELVEHLCMFFKQSLSSSIQEFLIGGVERG